MFSLFLPMVHSLKETWICGVSGLRSWSFYCEWGRTVQWQSTQLSSETMGPGLAVAWLLNPEEVTSLCTTVSLMVNCTEQWGVSDRALMRGAQCMAQRKHLVNESCYSKQLVVRVSVCNRNEHRIDLTCSALPSCPRMDLKAMTFTDSLDWMSLSKEVAESRQKLSSWALSIWGHEIAPNTITISVSLWLLLSSFPPPVPLPSLSLPFPWGVGWRHGGTNGGITTSTPKEGIYLIAKEHILAADNKWCVMLPWSEMDGALRC